MAQLDTGGGEKKGKGGKVRSKKNSGSVDLTAMVDLAFLLITFFMLTTTLSKPQSMTLNMPDKEKERTEEDNDIKVDEHRTMTILIGKDDHMEWYMGQFATPVVEPSRIEYGKNGIRKELLERIKSVVAKTGDKEKGLVVIIKPSDKSTYRNLVDILDEMAITKVPTYAIVDITAEEIELLERDNIY